jgi:hypothetical protein
LVTRIPEAGLFALALLAASAAACRPRALDRSARVGARDAAGGSSSPDVASDGRNGGSSGSGGSGGGVGSSDSGASGAAGTVSPVSDAQRDVASASDTAPPPPDVARDVGPAELTVNALLARTPPTCAMRLTPDLPLAPVGDAAAGESAAICGLNGAVYWVADMDIDCDGRTTPGTGCASVAHSLDTSTRGAGGAALAGSVTPFVVVPGNLNIPGLRAGGVVAVINQLTKQMTYAIVGDTSLTNIGGASPACADRVGINSAPMTGQRGRTVVYIAFTGANAVPADVENQAQTTQIGDTLTAQFIAANR